MELRPLHDRLLVRRVEQEAKTTGRDYHSRHCPEKTHGRQRHRGRTGHPRRRRQSSPARCQGRRSCLFAKWSGTEVKIDGEELMIMKESDVIGIIDSGAAAGNAS